MQLSFYSLGQWLGWKIRNCGSKLKRKKFMKKKLKSLGAFLRGEVHNREEGEIGWKSREEGEIGWKSREEGEIGWKSREEWEIGWKSREEGEIGWKSSEEGEIGWKSREEGEIGWKSREEGEIGWKSREEGEIGWKSREEGEIGWKSGEEGDLPSCTFPVFLYLHSHWKLNDWKTPVPFIKLSFEQCFAFKHAAEGQYEQIISFEAFYSRSVSDRNPICLGCDRVKKNSMAREKRGGVSSP